VTSEDSRTSNPLPRRLSAWTGAALLLNLVIFAIGNAAGATWEVDAPVTIGPVPVAATTVLAMGLGGLVVIAITRRNERFRFIAARAGLIFAIVSAPSPFLVSSDPTSSVALASMHVVTGVAWFLWLREPRTR
jgi:hypothetical protein